METVFRAGCCLAAVAGERFILHLKPVQAHNVDPGAYAGIARLHRKAATNRSEKSGTSSLRRRTGAVSKDGREHRLGRRYRLSACGRPSRRAIRALLTTRALVSFNR
jgi:hypothetical protein